MQKAHFPPLFHLMKPLNMYRSLLRAGRFYPSVKRESVIREIKDAFRENRALHDPEELAYCEEEAQAALNLLHRYVGVKHNTVIGFSMPGNH